MAIFNTVYGGEYHLPWTYQKVEYIQSSWTQRIDTWLTVNSDGRVFQLKYEMLSAWSEPIVFWTITRNEWDVHTRFARLSNQFEWDCYKWSWNWRITYNKSIPSWAEDIEFWNNYIKDISTWTTLVTWTAANFSTSDPIPIFCAWEVHNNVYNRYSSLRLYYFKVIDNWVE